MGALQSMTLLRNDLATGLPFTPGRKLVVVGTDIDDINSFMQPSNYNSNNICPKGGTDPAKRWDATQGAGLVNHKLYYRNIIYYKNQNGATSGFDMSFRPTTLGAGAKTRLESSI